MSIEEPRSEEERTWAMLAHLLAGIVCLVTAGALGWIPGLVIYLIRRDQSRFVAFHSLESLIFQLVWMALLVVGWTVTGILTFVLVGVLLIPVMVALTFVPVIWPIVASVKARSGEWYDYPVVGEWARGTARSG